MTGTRKVQIAVFDDNGNLQATITHDFAEDGIGITDYTCPAGNGHDRLLAVFRNSEDDLMRLIEFNTSGEVTRTVDRDLELPKLLDYWPGQGWLYLDRPPGSDYWRANLIDDELNIRWRRELNYQGSDDYQNKPDQIAFHDTTAVVYWFDKQARMIRAEIGASSTPLRSDSLYFFSDEFIDRRNSFGWLKPAADGGWWLLVNYSRQLQKIASDGTRVFGDSGLVVTDNLFHYLVLPDTEGGAWVIWVKNERVEPVEKIRAIHFDANGERVGDNYPDDGLDIFDNGSMSLVDAAFDPNTGNVWVVAERSESSHGDIVSRELWVQLVGENVVSVPGINPARIYDFSLSPAYPNPFNNTTTIPFSLADRATVSLRAYDLNGRLVQDLSPLGSLSSGQHEIVWNAQALSTGIYFVRLESEGRSAVRRAFLLK